jgi:hypothetical protein
MKAQASYRLSVDSGPCRGTREPDVRQRRKFNNWDAEAGLALASSQGHRVFNPWISMGPGG